MYDFDSKSILGVNPAKMLSADYVFRKSAYCNIRPKNSMKTSNQHVAQEFELLRKICTTFDSSS